MYLSRNNLFGETPRWRGWDASARNASRRSPRFGPAGRQGQRRISWWRGFAAIASGSFFRFPGTHYEYAHPHKNKTRQREPAGFQMGRMCPISEFRANPPFSLRLDQGGLDAAANGNHHFDQGAMRFDILTE